jgi:hypothetical protein
MYNEIFATIYLDVENAMINLFNSTLEKTGHSEKDTKEIMQTALESAYDQFYERYYK